MLLKDLIGKEVIDAKGDAVGVVEDFVITQNGRITHLILLPVGVVSKMTRAAANISFEDVEAMEDVIILNKTKSEI